MSLARAFVANHEVLCLHKPTEPLGENTALSVLRTLREFVNEKGVALDCSRKDMRRPRTCIFTSSKTLAAKMADTVFHVSKKDGIQLKSIAELVAADFD